MTKSDYTIVSYLTGYFYSLLDNSVLFYSLIWEFYIRLSIGLSAGLTSSYYIWLFKLFSAFSSVFKESIISFYA